MSECGRFDALVTPYVDGALGADERTAVEQHLRACPPCRSRVSAESAIHVLMTERRADLCSEAAPSQLHERCAILAKTPPVSARPLMSRVARYAVAATIVIAVGALALQQLTRASTRVMAAELAADHVKCVMLNAVLGTHHTPAEAERLLETRFAWDLDLPADTEHAGLSLVGARQCMYGDGIVAHLMYEHHGQPVSVFMLPATMRREEVVGVFGHEAAVWSSGNRTFVLLARESRAEVEQLAKYVRATLH